MTVTTPARLGDYVRIRTGKLDANASDPHGCYPFFTCADTPLRISSFGYDCECVLVAGNGDLNVKYYNGKFDAYQRTYIIESVDKLRLDSRYLFHFMSVYVEQLRSMSIGGVIKYIKLGYLTDAKIPLPPLPEQRRIADVLDLTEALRAKRRFALRQLDTLSQAMFFDLFGGLGRNARGFERLRLAELCISENDVKCGPFGTQLAKNEYKTEGVPLWGIKSVNARFELATKEFLDARTASRLGQYSIEPGDIVMTRKGTVGNCAVYPDSYPVGIMHSDLLRVRVSLDKCDPVFLSHQLHFSSDVERQMALISGGAVMPGVNVTKLKDLTVTLPPLSSQQTFSRRVASLERLARVHRTSLLQMDTLFGSLQHRAFRGEL